MNRKATLLLAASLVIVAAAAQAQTTTYQQVAPQQDVPLLFGFAAYKICQIKSFVFSMFYILAIFGFLIMAVKWVFIKFEIKNLISIVGAVFVLATSDLLIDFVSNGSAYYCPSLFG